MMSNVRSGLLALRTSEQEGGPMAEHMLTIRTRSTTTPSRARSQDKDRSREQEGTRVWVVQCLVSCTLAQAWEVDQLQAEAELAEELTTPGRASCLPP